MQSTLKKVDRRIKTAHVVEDVYAVYASNDRAECWQWPGALDGDGYGRQHSKGKIRPAHRLIFETVYGPVPEGMIVDHKCRNRACVNPEHLHLVTKKQNAENAGLRSDNKSGIRGVHWSTRDKRWIAKVKHNGVIYSGGAHHTIDEAAKAVLRLRNRFFSNNLSDSSEWN